MFSLEIECGPDEKDFLIAELWELGSAGIAELSPRVRAGVLRRRRPTQRALLNLYPGARWRVEEDRDWVKTARELLRPMEVGTRFYLVPVWRDDPTPEGRMRIAVNPGMAFGTGAHETTQSVPGGARRLPGARHERARRRYGSGILAEAARLLGAGRCTLATRTRPPWKSPARGSIRRYAFSARWTRRPRASPMWCWPTSAPKPL